jgi:hypothetical protein
MGIGVHGLKLQTGGIGDHIDTGHRGAKSRFEVELVAGWL